MKSLSKFTISRFSTSYLKDAKWRRVILPTRHMKDILILLGLLILYVLILLVLRQAKKLRKKQGQYA